MTDVDTKATGRFPVGQVVGSLAAVILVAILWWPVLRVMAGQWSADPSLSHGPLVPVISAWLLWSRRSDLRRWDAATPAGLALLVAAVLLHVASVWADIEVLKAVSLILVLAGAAWYLSGRRALNAAAAGLGFLLFMVPWPTTVVERLAFPLQLTSSSYAAALTGLLGMDVARDGVQLSVSGYSILVAQKCSGLTSLTVLLALGYLIACYTPLRLGWRALMLAVVPPLAICANAVRLTLVLEAGGHGHKAMATWIHDHESPVLVLLCSIALVSVRAGLLAWLSAKDKDAGRNRAPASPAPSGGGNDAEEVLLVEVSSGRP